MIIKQLNISSFGKFQNKTIDFEKGINLIYGLNETGKSTIHKFIEGMIFGFYNPNVSRRQLLDDHEKYDPRDQNSYYGSMIVNYNGKDLKIERDFNKQNPSLKILDNLTGEDLTDTLPINASLRLPDLASYLGVDYTLYKDTISVSQMKSETSSDLSSVVSEKLSNLTTSKTETISVPSVLKKLEEQKSKIGSKNARTRPYFLTKQKLDNLKEELQTSNDKYEQIPTYQQNIKTLKDDRFTIDEKLSFFNTQKAIYNNELLKERYNIVKELNEEKEKLNEQSQKLTHLKDLNEKDYDQALRLNTQTDILTKDLNNKNTLYEKLLKEKSNLDKQLSKEQYLNNQDIDNLNIQDSYYKYKGLTNEVNSLNENLKRISNERPDTYIDLQEDYQKFNEINNINYQDEINQLNYQIINENQKLEIIKQRMPNDSLKILYYILVPLLIGIVLLLIYNKNKKDVDNKLIEQTKVLNELNNKLNKAKESQNEQTIQNKHLFDKYNVLTADEFRILVFSNRPKISEEELLKLKETLISKETELSLLKEALETIFNNIVNIKDLNDHSFTLVIQKLTNFKTLKEKSNTINNQQEKDLKSLNEVKEELTDKTNQLKEILKNNKVDNIKDFKQSLDEKRKYESLVKSIEAIDLRMKDHLKGMTIKELEQSIDFTKEERFDKEAYEKLAKEEAKLREELSPIIEEETRLNGLILQIENNNREPSLITNDIKNTQDLLNELDLEISSIDLAIKKLNKVSESIRYEFAPKLNSKISNIIKKITNDKYDDVKIDKDMNVRVFEKSTNKDVELNGFSMGTIDQLYLSMRLGINRTITENIYPLLLDDTFVNYDIDRLKNTFEILIKESKNENRQVIMFTCHEVQKEVLKELGIKYKEINL